jgi:cellulose biosynthesis protein BcsQ
MRDLRPDLANLWRTLANLPTHGDGRVVQFLGAGNEDGVTSVAASFALLAERRTQKPVWLVDFDLRRNSAFHGFETGFAEGIARPSRAYDASLGLAPPYVLTPRPGLGARDVSEADHLLCMHEIEGTRLLVSRFRNEKLEAGERVEVRAAPDWWRALRDAADWIIVDAPATERSGAGLAVVGQADGVVLVVRADATPAGAVAELRQDVEAHGGRILGVIMTHTGRDALIAGRMGL